MFLKKILPAIVLAMPVKPHKLQKKIALKTEKLDTFVQTNAIERINFIKADIEGAERNLFADAHI